MAGGHFWAPQMARPKRKMEDEECYAGLAKGLPRAKTDGGGTFRGTNIGLPRSWHDEPTHLLMDSGFASLTMLSANNMS